MIFKLHSISRRLMCLWLALTSAPLLGGATSPQRTTTIQGVAHLTKDGLLVNDVVIPDGALPKGTSTDALSGTTIRITGTLVHVPAEPPQAPPPAPQVQMRGGAYDELRAITDVTIMKGKTE